LRRASRRPRRLSGSLEKLPEANRATAKAEMVTKFTPEQLKAIHAKMEAKK